MFNDLVYVSLQERELFVVIKLRMIHQDVREIMDTLWWPCGRGRLSQHIFREWIIAPTLSVFDNDDEKIVVCAIGERRLITLCVPE